ncbi:MAG: amino acid permease [Gammaproteobacteria bacterium]|nr:MAG: amino acid permease [Gammaproteobacteria bacterium]
MPQPTLKRSLSLFLITLYGLGNILGAGIYVLVGKVAGEAGYFAPLSFLIASVIAAISAFSYAELSARYPVSAGEAVYVDEGFGLQKLSLIVGLMITLAGIVSAAAIAHGFAGYLRVFFDIPGWLAITLLIVLLGCLAAWGINQSVKVAALLTLAEITGLLIIIYVGADQVTGLSILPEQIELLDQDDTYRNFSLLGIFSGAFLAFYAYIGFEDMVNIAEEVKNPQRNMPRAILLCVVVSSLLYAGVTLVSLSVLTPAELKQTDAPLAAVYARATGNAPVVITVIGIFAVINGALIQLIMSSRLLYGMASKQWLPGFLGRINPVTRTPINSTVLTVLLMLFFAMTFQIVALAEFTSYLVLMVFALVNLALIKIKQKSPDPDGVIVFSVWLPRLGFLTTISFLLIEVFSGLFY